jgi:lambda family phage minor tail protein L
MKTLTAALILEKNKTSSDDPWIILFEMDLDNTDTLRLAAYPEDVFFPNTTSGNTYTAFPAITEPIKENAQGKLNTLNVHVANIDRTMIAYVENNNLLGRDVTVRIVNADNLDDSTAKLDFTYRINQINITAETATFELGHEDLFAMQVPRQRYIRSKCRFVFKDSNCGYTGGETICDYTLDGPKGCRDKDNTLNFGGAPALPYGRLYGI